MRVHHLNCVSACPLGGVLMDGVTAKSLRGRLTCHCLLVETPGSLVLVDTGYGIRDVRDPHSRLSSFFLTLVKPELREEMTAVRQVRALGYDPRDVRQIVLSHLDFDHAGGLDDFPQASVHLLAEEANSAMAQRTLLDRLRYRPQQWSTRSMWRMYAPDDGETWRGFSRVQKLEGVPPEVLLVPLIGHTLGHAGVAVERDQGNWLFYTADAYFYHAEMDEERPHCTPGLSAYQTMMEKDRKQRLLNQERLRELRRKDSAVTIFCAHDVLEFERLSSRSSSEPAGAERANDSNSSPARAAELFGARM